MTTTEHKALTALRQTLLTLGTPHARRNKPTGTSEGLAVRACQDAIPALEALIDQNAELLAALERLACWASQRDFEADAIDHAFYMLAKAREES